MNLWHMSAVFMLVSVTLRPEQAVSQAFLRAQVFESTHSRSFRRFSSLL